MATFSLVSTLRFDFSNRPWLAPDTVMFAPAVKSPEAPVDIREIAPDEFIAPFTVMLPRASRVRPDPEVELEMLLTTVMSPLLSTTMLLCPIAVTKSLIRIFAVPEVLDWNMPLTNVPSVEPDAVMFTAAAVKEDASWILVAVLGELELLLVLAMTLKS
jgi:hypothetical protein